ncbi:uncharacterized protein LOC132548803 [Ylistrum balloti]|uniref:uncharacterized protein LOC132548803 n=1 Tax=Ylistrum balloti TaxID=509963 RepID=UPI002905AC83|nr:uncharacterized protein LOC132548803 [Ylistrum balloti]
MGIRSERLCMTLLSIYTVITVNGHNCPGKTIIQVVQHEQQLSQTFLSIDIIGLQQCSRACLLRTKCQVIAFDFPTANCELGENVAYITVSSSNTTGTILRSALVQFEPFLLESCVGHSCDVDSKCVELSSGQFTCVSTLAYIAPTTTTSTTATASTTTTTSTTTTATTTTTTTMTTTPSTTTTLPTTTTEAAEILCPLPPTVLNAETPTTAESSVGASHSYTCLTGHLLNGNPQVTCQQNGQWSSPEFTCIPCDTNDFVYDSSLQFCYKLQITTRYKHTDAISYCAGFGGRLAKVDTPEKLALLSPSIATRAFVDGSDSSIENTWIYSDGSSVNMNLFSAGMPTTDTGLNCLVIQSGYILEQECDVNRYVVCDKQL